VARDVHALIFDRTGQEGDFERQFAGDMIGYNTAVLGALAAAWVEQRAQTDWCAAARDGIGLARELLYGGYVIEHERLQFPVTRLCAALQNDTST
jgi:hypothetical protein